MRLGLYMDLRNPAEWRRPWSEVYPAALELCVEAEQRGAHSVWLSEHHLFDDGYLTQPLTFASAIAARTARIRIGTAILLAPIRTAAEIAENAALVDLVSNGRLDLGIGAGYRKPEFELFGANPERPLAQLFDRAREVRRLIDSGGVTPRPVQDPFPLWIGTNGPRGARRAGRLGERLLSAQPQLVEEYRAGLAEGGHEPTSARMSGPVNIFLSDDPERDWPIVSRYLGYQWDSYNVAAVEGTDRPAPPPVDTEAARANGLTGGLRGCLVTTPDDAEAQLRATFLGTPVETVFAWAWLPGVPDEIVQRHIELWCELEPRLADFGYGTDPATAVA